jgi:ribosomal protein L6P/L9E
MYKMLEWTSRKRVLLIAASILAARKLSQYDGREVRTGNSDRNF